MWRLFTSNLLFLAQVLRALALYALSQTLFKTSKGGGMGDTAIAALQAESYQDIFEISIAGLPTPNGRLNVQNKLAYPDFNT